MGKLRDSLGLADPDGLYERLVAMHHGLGEEESRLVMAKLVLLLANHVGDSEVLDEAIRVARGEDVVKENRE